ncbi:putative Response regulator receiver protein [Candidatus Competibacter denitrificans Run_A_D11]|uniref:Response regulator receiver protein n=1 Tax=Candidatus Competibacter denitrificans Run_A_D11 TaxID=1400863 RepID=W6M7G6_9GAMM|nr:response regulator [Candidatus Competibacter denitrificans]CDI01625.1 putative Response regulator receiver protein [Candidatus Competibacter denitrificans Run_A_D11]HRC69728.1 response regulator [Candidatus Competibacter denitrificans]
MGKKTFQVAMIGISESERNILRNIFKLSQYRNYTYIVAVPGELTDILIVDADDPQAMGEWRQAKGGTATGGSTSYRSNIPTIMVTHEEPPDSILHYIRRPFVASRVINVLDHLANKELQSDHERIIGVDPNQKLTTEPVKPAADSVVKADAPNAAPTLTALVVDDSAPVRKQIELELKMFGIHVHTAETGEQAIEYINKNYYNLVFLDVVLPGIDGYQLCKMFKKDKAKKKIPVIMLTSKSSPFDRVKGALAGCDTYLTKPVKQETFQKTVKKYLK